MRANAGWATRPLQRAGLAVESAWQINTRANSYAEGAAAVLPRLAGESPGHRVLAHRLVLRASA